MSVAAWLAAAAAGAHLDDAALAVVARDARLPDLLRAARARRDRRFGDVVTYSPKVFIPLTRLCRDACGYCTFATTPARLPAPYLLPEEVLAIARAGARAGCREALFTLGDKPELRWPEARAFLAARGHGSTVDYVIACARAVVEETGLLPHVNAGSMEVHDIVRLREVSVSQGTMMEILADRLGERGGPHYRCPDKTAAVRLATLAAAGRVRVPFTTGVLVGIGETLDELVGTLCAIRAAHDRHGHVQEVIVQNFRAKPQTTMSRAPHCDDAWHQRAIALARLALDADVTVQAPPNLAGHDAGALLDAGIDDWGGISPVTPDHVNPEAPWPAVAALAQRCATRGKFLVARLAVHPRYVHDAGWGAPGLRRHVLRHADAAGLARDTWSAGQGGAGTLVPWAAPAAAAALHAIVDRALEGAALGEADLVTLLTARGAAAESVVQAADALRRVLVGEPVSYVVTRNINYTNVCKFHCTFCAFSKGSVHAQREAGYDLDLAEIVRRAREAWRRGATEVCLQGGIHPRYDGNTYRAIVAAIRDAVPGLHVHAFSPLEIAHGAQSLGLDVASYLRTLRAAGLSSLPGTAAEILDDDVRATLCPDKLGTQAWLDVMRAAHDVGLRSTATIMFGHVDAPVHWARHLLRIRALQEETGGFTEFVPLPYVAFESPLYRRGRSRAGPTFREAVLLHAVARLAFGAVLPNIQTSWVKMGPAGAAACLRAGANDLGGTLMDESITRAAGARHGQEMLPAMLERIAADAGRPAWQRTTLYAAAPAERRNAAAAAAPLHVEPATGVRRAQPASIAIVARPA